AVALWLLGRAYGFAGAPGADPAAALPAPQAGLMALVSQGIVGGEMVWPLFLAGMLFGVMLILVRAPSPMLVAVGMYLPIYSTFAIFVGGVLRWIVDRLLQRKKYSPEAMARATNTGILVASGFVAGEALMGVCIAGLIVGFNLRGGEALIEVISNPTVQGILGL
ncbi:MAG: oligopeptide transporter, OPT family, partial [Gemmatimonadetes bacterium]|nr:oligopeptide transporter, OPT family [Gemmatimonadota bacterium]